MEVNVQHAKTHLSKVLAAAENGEVVLIAGNGKPAVKLVVVQPQVKSRRNIIGSGIGKIWMTPDFDSPGSKAEIADMFESGIDFD